MPRLEDDYLFGLLADDVGRLIADVQGWHYEGWEDNLIGLDLDKIRLGFSYGMDSPGVPASIEAIRGIQSSDDVKALVASLDLR